MSDTIHPPTELKDLMSSASNTNSSTSTDTVTPTTTTTTDTTPISNKIGLDTSQDSNNDSIETQTYVEPSKKNGFHWLKVFFVSILKLILVLIVGKLAWECNKSQTLLLRVFYTSFAVMFSELYIIYYAVYRTYLGNTCPIV